MIWPLKILFSKHCGLVEVTKFLKMCIVCTMVEKDNVYGNTWSNYILTATVSA